LIYYCRFRSESGEYLIAMSTGQTSRAAAENWANNELAKGKILTPGKRGAIFSTFADGFWNYDGEYITRRLARGGHYSKSFAKIRAGQLEHWILPYFKDRPLGAIQRSEIEAWQMKLFCSRKIMPATINRVMDNLSVIMKEACRRGFISADPAAGIENLVENHQPRGILLPNEIRVLFGPDALEMRWKCARPPYVAAFLTIGAGLRIGEVRALRVTDVHPDFVAVTGSWEEGYGRKGAKWGSERIVPIPSRVARELEILISESKYKESEDLIFMGHQRGVPLDKHGLYNCFYAALAVAGIDAAARCKRCLVWHSMRHTFNSLMRGRIDGGKLMRIVGHRQESTNMLYTHALPEDLVAVRSVQEDIFT
jgi:integrase